MSDAPKNSPEETPEGAPPQAFESTLPMAGGAARPAVDQDLDLDVDDIQTRLPYGSEDIADK